MAQDKAATFAAQWATEAVRMRWARIAFWTPTELEGLHRRERLLARRCGVSGYAPQDDRHIETVSRAHDLYPFWPKDLTEGEKADRMRLFYAQIYSVWCPLVKAAMEVEAADPGRKNPAADFEDLRVLHQCDVALMNYGFRPDRSSPPRHGDKERGEKRERVATRARDVYAD